MLSWIVVLGGRVMGVVDDDTPVVAQILREI